MNDPSSIAVVFITPRTKRITISEHDKTIGHLTLFLEIVKDAIKVSTTATSQLIVINRIHVLTSERLVVVHLRIKASDVDLISIERGHHACDFRNESLALSRTDRPRHIDKDRNVNLLAGIHTGHNSISVPAAARRAHPREVRLDSTGQIALNQITPRHNRFGHLLNKALDTLRHATCLSRLCSTQDSLLDFLANFLTFGFGQSRTLALALTVLAILVIRILIAVTITVEVLVNHLRDEVVEVDRLSILHKIIVNLFRSPAIVLCLEQARNRLDELTNSVTLEVSIYRVVISDIEDVVITIAETTNVIVHHVKDLMSNQELNFLGLEKHNESGVVVETHTVSSSSAAPIVSIDQLHAGSKIAKERMIE